MAVYNPTGSGSVHIDVNMSGRVKKVATAKKTGTKAAKAAPVPQPKKGVKKAVKGTGMGTATGNPAGRTRGGKSKGFPGNPNS